MITTAAFWMVGALLLGLLIFVILRAAENPSKAVAGRRKHSSSPPDRIDALILGDLDNPLLELTPIDSTVAKPVGAKLDPALIIALQPLLQRAPELLAQGNRMAHQGYKIVFSSEVTHALRKGTLELLPSGGELLPIARNASGGNRLVEIARFAKSGGIKLAGVAAASWQVLSIATAQHFLNEINARLAGIEEGIKDIQHWLQDDKKAQLTAAAGYLREAHAAIKRGGLHPDEISALYSQLETLEVSARSIGELAKDTAQRRITELQNLDIKHWMDRKGSAARARDWLQSSKNVVDLLLLAQAMRVLGCQVKALLPGDRQRLADRLANTKREVNAAAVLFDSAREAYLQKVNELRKRHNNPLAFWGVLDKDRQRELENEFAIVREAVGQAAERFEQQTHSALEMTQRLDALADEGMTLEMRTNKEGKTEIYQLPSQAA